MTRTSGPTVFVVIPVHNRLHFTRRCLDCLRRQTYPNLRTIVVDDGSTDGTGEVLRRVYPEVIVLEGTGNLWWAGGTNHGVRWAMARAADGDFVLLLNNDLTFEERLVEILVHYGEARNKCVVGAIESSIQDPQRIVCGARQVNWWTGRQRKMHVGRLRSSLPRGLIVPSDYLTGRGVLYPVRCLREIGLVDERYRHAADMELSVRAHKRGYQLLCAYEAVVYHDLERDDKGINAGSYRWSDLTRYFFDIRSYACLRYVALNAIKCTRNPLQAASFFACSTAFLFLHFVKCLHRESCAGGSS